MIENMDSSHDSDTMAWVWHKKHKRLGLQEHSRGGRANLSDEIERASLGAGATSRATASNDTSVKMDIALDL